MAKVDEQVTPERESFIDNLLVRIHFITEMIWWTGLATWECEFPCREGETGKQVQKYLAHKKHLPL